MQCPIDGTPLVMTDRSGVEIDYCPTCRGVWLDRGELDKIIERSTPDMRSTRAAPGSYKGDHAARPRKKKSGFDLIGDIFDF